MNEFNFDGDELISLLKPYQRKILVPLIESVGEEEAAKIWLSTNNNDQFSKFGGTEGSKDPYFDRLVAEIRKLICGDESYKEFRDKLIENAHTSSLYVVGAIAGVMGDVFGITSALITPVVILILKTISKVGVNAWCQV